MAIATKDKVLDLEAAGFADIAGDKPMQPDSLFLDRLAIEADHLRGSDDAR